MSMSTNLTAETNAAGGFALVLEVACGDYEVLSALIRNEIKVEGNGFLAVRAQGTILMALAKSFLFHLERSRRICEQGSQSLGISRAERKAFLRALEPVKSVRHVNEHGFDLHPGSRGKRVKPSLSFHEKESASADETSMIILGPEKILMGPLNLFDYYAPVDRMRKLAGFGVPSHSVLKLA